MARDWASTFQGWSNPPSDSEEARCGNAERMIREAINRDPTLAKMKTRVFTQGSYRHNTNVRLDSDVDIGVCLYDTFFFDLPDLNVRETISAQKARFGIADSAYTFKEFKDNVEAALVSKFGRTGVTRGNKALDVHANSYRVDADVVPCFEYRRYTNTLDRYGNPDYHSGTQFRPDNGGSIINWPEQNATNGVQKNNATNYRYKYLVRIVKRLRNEMQSNNIAAANIPSFLIESLLWNAPNSSFNGGGNYVQLLREVLAYLFSETMNDVSCKEWAEVNELKYLFYILQPWTRLQAHNFISAAWNYVGLE